MTIKFQPTSLIIYAESVDVSTDFYRDVLNSNPIERFDGFSVFILSEGITLGIQSKSGITPKPEDSFGGFEISASNADRETVDYLYAEWVKKGVRIEMAPTELDFGYTFVALDPDGHRLRVCATDTTNIKKIPLGRTSD